MRETASKAADDQLQSLAEGLRRERPSLTIEGAWGEVLRTKVGKALYAVSASTTAKQMDRWDFGRWAAQHGRPELADTVRKYLP